MRTEIFRTLFLMLIKQAPIEREKNCDSDADSVM